MNYITAAVILVALVTALANSGATLNNTRRSKRCSTRGRPPSKRPSSLMELSRMFLQTYNRGWPKECLTGRRQSPINLVQSRAHRRVEDIMFHSYEDEYNVELINNGHTVDVLLKEHLPDGGFPYVTGSALEGAQNNLLSFHFHWDAEHTINSYRYPLECHFLHYRNDLSTFTEAIKHDHGFAILSVMYQVRDRCPQNIFGAITSNISIVSTHVNSPYNLANKIRISNFLPRNTGTFYRYDGSLTSPNCAEGALWIVFDKPSCIERTQYSRLTRIRTQNNQWLLKNDRYLQKLNGRDVYYVSA